MAQPSVAILNPFDPLWGEEREGRYAYLARRLAEDGWQVTWITSDWSHRHKQRRDVTALLRRVPAGVRVEFVPTRPYDRNVCLARLASHEDFSRAAASVLGRVPADVVVVSTPPPALADAAVAVAHRRGARAIVDVQDLWPDEFRRLWPPGLRWLNDLVFWRMRSAYRRACREADARVAVAEVYLADARRFGAAEHDAVIHLGVDLEAFDRDAREGASLVPVPPGDEPPVLFWGGTIGSGSDWMTVLEAVARVAEDFPGCTLAVLGTGPDDPAMRQVSRERGWDGHVRFFGWQPHPAWAATLARSDAAINSWAPGSTVAFPNRAFDFLAAGRAVVTSAGGEFGMLVEQEAIGLNYPAGSADGLTRAIVTLLADDDERREMGRRARRLAEERFDRRIEYQRYVDLCRRLTGDRRP